MSLSTYLLYVAAVALLIVTPGPTMLMCMSNAANHGPRRAITSVAGAVTAVLGVMLLSAMGLGALLAASETAFTVAKVAGAAYLIWLGIKTFRSEAVLRPGEAAPRGRSFYLQGLLVGASNPKAVLFFAAFFPQFLHPDAPIAPQFALLALTFVVLEFAVLTACALGVSRLLPLLRSTGAVRWINRICGGLFTLMGALLLFTRRST
jgi:threonine/homoserine/homoserine lactone efflux protein